MATEHRGESIPSSPHVIDFIGRVIHNTTEHCGKSASSNLYVTDFLGRIIPLTPGRGGSGKHTHLPRPLKNRRASEQ